MTMNLSEGPVYPAELRLSRGTAGTHKESPQKSLKKRQNTGE